LLVEYKGVETKTQLKPKQQPEVKPATATTSATTGTGSPSGGALNTVQNFFTSVVEKSSLRSPDVDPMTHFFNAVTESYNEQGGTESVVKTFSEISASTLQQIQTVENKIAEKGVTGFLVETLEDAEKKSLEVGGAILDGVGKLEEEAQKSGGYPELIKKEMNELNEAVAPIASQVGSVLVESGSQAGGVLLDGLEKIEKDVESKGGLPNYLKAESETAMVKGTELGSALANGAAVFGQDVQTKGFQAAVTHTWTALYATFTAPKKTESSAASGFDEESF